jgi:hypothetical protein
VICNKLLTEYRWASDLPKRRAANRHCVGDTKSGWIMDGRRLQFKDNKNGKTLREEKYNRVPLNDSFTLCQKYFLHFDLREKLKENKAAKSDFVTVL